MKLVEHAITCHICCICRIIIDSFRVLGIEDEYVEVVEEDKNPWFLIHSASVSCCVQLVDLEYTNLLENVTDTITSRVNIIHYTYFIPCDPKDPLWEPRLLNHRQSRIL